MKVLDWRLLILSLVFLAGCNEKNQANDDDEIREIPVTELVSSNTDLHRTYVADINAFRNVQILARVSGYLEKVNVDEGKEVRKGQVLFEINDEEYASALATAKANLQVAIAEAKAAEVEMKRVQLLVDRNVVASSELDVAMAQLAARNAKIEEARSLKDRAELNYSYTKIRAPFDGVVDRIPYKIGSIVATGTPLTSISDITSVFAYFNVSEIEYLEYVRARNANGVDNHGIVELGLADGTFFSQKGKIETMESEFDEGTGSIAFRARFSNPEKLLKHGSSGTIRLTNTVENIILIPQKSVFEIQDKNFVYVLNPDNSITTRNFIPQARYSNYYLVKSGLKAGDKIVSEGVQNLRDGAVIKPKMILADSLGIIPNGSSQLTAQR
jgi:membrane fusion protein (multidrug efflux system)